MFAFNFYKFKRMMCTNFMNALIFESRWYTFYVTSRLEIGNKKFRERYNVGKVNDKQNCERKRKQSKQPTNILCSF